MKESKLVWTSDPEEARRQRELGKSNVAGDTEPSSQTVRVAVDRKRRAGKAVTLASGFALTEQTLSALATHLKKKCGAGGTAREGVIEIQGEHRAAVEDELRKLGYRVK